MLQPRKWNKINQPNDIPKALESSSESQQEAFEGHVGKF